MKHGHGRARSTHCRSRAALARLGFMVAVFIAQAEARAQPAPITEALADWTPVAAEAERFRFADGVLRIEGGGGWLQSAARYDDFVVRLELRFVSEDADSGLFLRVEPGAEFGPAWPRSSDQVQLRNPLGESPFPPVGGLFRHGGGVGETRFDEAAARSAFTGTGEWQTLLVRVEADTLEVELNGTRITEADGLSNASGYVGLQSERGVLEIRALEIEPR